MRKIKMQLTDWNNLKNKASLLTKMYKYNSGYSDEFKGLSLNKFSAKLKGKWLEIPLLFLY